MASEPLDSVTVDHARSASPVQTPTVAAGTDPAQRDRWRWFQRGVVLLEGWHVVQPRLQGAAG